MAFNRRELLMSGMFAMMLSGCAKAETVPHIGLPMLDPVAWGGYKVRFFLPEGRIVDTGNGEISHSEGQGYGMVLAVAAGDRPAFEALLRWTQATLTRLDGPLHSWRYVPGQGVTDPNNATDGDILIAWALLAAGRKWGEPAWLEQSSAIRRALAAHLVVSAHGMTLLLPGLAGFDAEDHVTVNPSYYVWPALDAFAQLEPDIWKPVINHGLRLIAKARFGPFRLPADWLDVKGDGIVEPAQGREPLFGFEGIRLPLYLTMSGRQAGARDIGRYWAGLLRKGQPLPAWTNLVTGEVAPFALSAGASAIAARLTGVAIPGSGPTGDYYSATLGLLSRVTLS
jgi:endoglucanase